MGASRRARRFNGCDGIANILAMTNRRGNKQRSKQRSKQRQLQWHESRHEYGYKTGFKVALSKFLGAIVNDSSSSHKNSKSIPTSPRLRSNGYSEYARLTSALLLMLFYDRVQHLIVTQRQRTSGRLFWGRQKGIWPVFTFLLLAVLVHTLRPISLSRFISTCFFSKKEAEIILLCLKL